MENATKIVCGGNNYLIVHLYDDCFYGRKSVYNVLTNNQKWCGSLIPELCGYNNVDSEGIHNMNYKRNPTIINALKPYYKVDFIEDNFYQTVYDLTNLIKDFPVDTDSYYKLEYIEPYDD